MALPMASFINPTVSATASQPASIDQFVRAQQAGYQTGKELGGDLENAVTGYTEGRQTAQRNTINQQTIEANEQLKIQRAIQMETEKLRQEAARLELEKETKRVNNENYQKLQDLNLANGLESAKNESAKIARTGEIFRQETEIGAIINNPDRPKKDALSAQYSKYWADHPKEYEALVLSPEVWNDPSIPADQKKAFAARIFKNKSYGTMTDAFAKSQADTLAKGDVNEFLQQLTKANPNLDSTSYLSGLTAVANDPLNPLNASNTYTVSYDGVVYDKPWSKDAWEAVLKTRQTGMLTKDLDPRLVAAAQGDIPKVGAPTASAPKVEVAEISAPRGATGPRSTANALGAAVREGIRSTPAEVMGPVLGPVVGAARSIGPAIDAVKQGAAAVGDFVSGFAGYNPSETPGAAIVRQKQEQLAQKVANSPAEQQQDYQTRLANKGNLSTQVPATTVTEGSGGGVEGGGNISEPAPTRRRPAVKSVEAVPESLRKFADTKAASIVNSNSELRDSPPLIKAIATVESAGNSKAKSPTGVEGLMQVTRATTRDMGFDPNIPEDDVRAGIKYIGLQLNRFKSLPLATAAYNAGPGAVQRAVNIAGSRNWSDVKRAMQFMVQQGEMTAEKYKEVAAYPDKVIANLHLFADSNDPIFKMV